MAAEVGGSKKGTNETSFCLSTGRQQQQQQQQAGGEVRRCPGAFAGAHGVVLPQRGDGDLSLLRRDARDRTSPGRREPSLLQHLYIERARRIMWQIYKHSKLFLHAILFSYNILEIGLQEIRLLLLLLRSALSESNKGLGKRRAKIPVTPPAIGLGGSLDTLRRDRKRYLHPCGDTRISPSLETGSKLKEQEKIETLETVAEGVNSLPTWLFLFLFFFFFFFFLSVASSSSSTSSSSSSDSSWESAKQRRIRSGSRETAVSQRVPTVPSRVDGEVAKKYSHDGTRCDHNKAYCAAAAPWPPLLWES